VVQVIDRKEDAGTGPRIDFRVNRSPTDPHQILGEWLHACGPDWGESTWTVAISRNHGGGLVAAEFQRALEYADSHDIPFVWVDDPLGLFPAAERLR
jgi:hypothetical protein